MEERLQKIISSCGVTSRRQAEGLILAGKVTVNGEIAQLGQKAELLVDEIFVEGKALYKNQQRSYFMLHKPKGYVTTLSDEKDRKTVADLMVDCGTRVWPVGRLDYNSEGLLLMTDDGAFTHGLLHPSHEVEKEYLVWVSGHLEEALPLLNEPMEIEGELLAKAKVVLLKKEGKTSQLSFTIHQGKNRQIRRMCQKVGLSVVRLKRIREGPLRLDPRLGSGKWRALTGEEVEMLTKELET